MQPEDLREHACVKSIQLDEGPASVVLFASRFESTLLLLQLGEQTQLRPGDTYKHVFHVVQQRHEKVKALARKGRRVSFGLWDGQAY